MKTKNDQKVNFYETKKRKCIETVLLGLYYVWYIFMHILCELMKNFVKIIGIFAVD